jgi:hypothetical protein
MQHPDEGTIHAWIDNELTADESAALEAHLSECAECSALAAEARGLVAASSRIVSALDIVPAGVIPKAAPRQRTWYASTQLRAAAAVMIVAGASLLVMRDRGATKMARVMENTAPRADQVAAPMAAPETPQAIVQSIPAPAVTQNPVRIASKNPVKKKSVAKQESDARDERATINDAVASRAAEKVADAPAALAAPIDSIATRRFNPTGQLSGVVTGVATVSAAPEPLKKVRADSSGTTTVYEALPGVEVALVDMGSRMEVTSALRAVPMAQSKERQAAAAAPAPPTVGNLSKAAQVNTISWTDRRGHLMTLTGPLSTEALEALRKRLPADRR